MLEGEEELAKPLTEQDLYGEFMRMGEPVSGLERCAHAAGSFQLLRLCTAGAGSALYILGLTMPYITGK